MSKLRKLYAKCLKKNTTVIDFWEDNLKKFNDNDCLSLIDSDKTLKYGGVNQMSHRVANCLSKIGVRQGDCLLLCMDNCPEYVILWLAVARLGGSVALINPELTGSQLGNSITEASTFSENGINLVIYGTEQEDQLKNQSVLKQLHSKGTFQLFSYSGKANSGNVEIEVDAFGHKWGSFDSAVTSASQKPVPVEVRAAAKSSDAFLYMPTSNPSEELNHVKINHARFIASSTLSSLLGLKADDSCYCPIPLYDIVGGLFAISCCFSLGLKVAIRHTFSSTNYFKDCADTEATVGMYVGEIGRYLTDTPRDIFDTAHKLRLLAGMGMRKGDWESFGKRFQIKKIAEFYATLESMILFCNQNNKAGGCGIPSSGAKIVKMKDPSDPRSLAKDEENQLGIECKKNEIGQLLELVNDYDPKTSMFKPERIVQNVFKEGDTWFLTGDIFKKSKQLSFVNSIPDVIIWKDEPVFPRLVEDSVRDAAVEKIHEINVYGVPLKFTRESDGTSQESTAVMACINFKPAVKLQTLDLSMFYFKAARFLAAHEQPMFILVEKNEIKANHALKHLKAPLQRKGFNPEMLGEDEILYYVELDTTGTGLMPRCVEMDQKLYERLISGKMNY
mmetsp:Transcript_16912/g.19201  ORF Transcript_16912/g.19201 Transcript_16912/m.19201 type:complete len:617 (-) Transcript_16912:1341-3191(-)